MHLTALGVALVACGVALALGGRFLLTPAQATLAFGIAADNARGLAHLAGIRNITSGLVLIAVWVLGGPVILGCLVAALNPIADTVIVLTNRGKISDALGRHGIAAALMVVAGLVLALR